MAQTPEDEVLGKIALHYKLVTPEQLTQANAAGDTPLGDALLQLKFISADQHTWLLNAKAQFLAKQRGSTGSNPALAPAAPAARAVPAQSGAKPGTMPPGPSPVAAPSKPATMPPGPSPIAAAAKPATMPPGPSPFAAVAGLDAPAAAPVAPAAAVGKRQLPTLNQILAKAVEAKASDVHLHSGAPLQMRLNGYLKELKTGLLDAKDIESILKDALSETERKALEENLDLDLALELPGLGRFRASFYRQQRGWDAVFRAIPPTPPTLEQLGLPATLKKFTEYHQGLVLVTGPAGCGKSSTLAALVSMLNESRHDHIITVEDPIEYVHTPKGCLVNQRQAGKHTKSFANALKGALREDPDIIIIGELRDLETIQLAITAAETGHLVMGTLHTNNAIRTINRVLDVFPPKQQSQIRAMVSESLRGIISQRLVPHADGTRRVVAVETLFVKPSISNLIREEKTFQIRSVMQTGRADGMGLLDDSLAELVKAGQVKKEDAKRFAEDPKRFA